MVDNSDAPAFDPSDADRLHRNYVETCKRLGVEPVPRERVQDLIREWAEVIANSAVPPVKTLAVLAET